MLRQAKQADTARIVELACASVANDPLPLKTDTTAMRQMASQVIGNPAHFCWVHCDGERVTACVAAIVQPGFWFRGLQMSVILYYAETPAAGGFLLRRLSRWMKSRSGIKLGVFELEPGHDPRLESLLSKLGFSRRSTNLTYVRKP